VLVAHALNPSYLGGWDQEDQGLRTAWAPHLQINQRKMEALSSNYSLTPKQTY
jgi:hypothetical protein